MIGCGCCVITVHSCSSGGDGLQKFPPQFSKLNVIIQWLAVRLIIWTLCQNLVCTTLFAELHPPSYSIFSFTKMPQNLWGGLEFFHCWLKEAWFPFVVRLCRISTAYLQRSILGLRSASSLASFFESSASFSGVQPSLEKPKLHSRQPRPACVCMQYATDFDSRGR